MRRSSMLMSSKKRQPKSSIKISQFKESLSSAKNQVNSIKTPMQNIKNNFTLTLNFLQFGQHEILLLEKFDEKLRMELDINSQLLKDVFFWMKMDASLAEMLVKLLEMKMERRRQKEVMFEIKGLASTAEQTVKVICEVVFFIRFLQSSISEYKSIMREFEARNITFLLEQLPGQNLSLLKSKIYSILLMIYIKYSFPEPILLIAPKCIQQRRILQRQFYAAPLYAITQDFVNSTFYFSIKYTESSLKVNRESCQILSWILQEKQICDQYFLMKKISFQMKNVFINEMNNLYSMIIKKAHQQYFQDANLQTNKGKSQSVNSLPRKASLRSRSGSRNLQPKASEIEKYVDLDSLKNINVKDIQPNHYNPRDAYGEVKHKDKIRKVRKKIQKTLFETKENVKEIKQIKELGCDAALKMSSLLLEQSEIKKLNTDMLLKIGNFCHITKEPLQRIAELAISPMEELRKTAKKTSSEIKSKQKSIEQLYASFANQNRIIREIATIKLAAEIKNVDLINFPHSQIIHEILFTPVLQFSAGLQDANQEINSLLNNKSCLELQFVKIWMENLFVCNVKLEITEEKYILKVQVNETRRKVILHRSKNVLCERYVTIWPTIRYLVHKKVIQFSVLKQLQSQLIFRKTADSANWLETSQFQYKFGLISQEEMEQINMCLDNIFKLLLILGEYEKQVSLSGVKKIEMAQQHPQTDLALQNFSFKELLHLQIYLANHCNITLASWIICHDGSFFQMQAFLSREDLIQNLLQKSSPIILFIHMIQLNQNHQEELPTLKVQIHWAELQEQLIFQNQYQQFFKQKICYSQINQRFQSQIMSFITKRVRIINKIMKKILLFAKPHTKTAFKSFQFQKINQAEFHCDQNNQLSPKCLQIIENNYDICIDRKHEPMRLKNNSKWKKIQSKIQSVMPFVLGLNRIEKERKNSLKTVKTISKPNYEGTGKKQTTILHQLGEMYNKEEIKIQHNIEFRPYLILINVLKESITENWMAEFKLINITSARIDCFYLSWMDYALLDNKENTCNRALNKKFSQISEISHAQSSIYEEHRVITQKIKQTNITLKLVNLINHFTFDRSDSIAKVSLHWQNKNYRTNSNSSAKYIRSSHTFDIFNCHYVHTFQEQVKVLLIKPFKIKAESNIKQKYAYGLLVFVEKKLGEYLLWELRLELPRKYSVFVCEFSEEEMIMLLAEQKKIKQKNKKKISSFFFLHLKSLQNQGFQSQQLKEQGINMKQKVIELFSRLKILQVSKDEAFVVVINEKRYNLKERLIWQYDQLNNRLYNVFLQEGVLEIVMHAQKQDHQESQDPSSSFTNSFKQEVIGLMDLETAIRLYNVEHASQQQNKHQYLQKVGQFYLEHCKHHRHKHYQ